MKINFEINRQKRDKPGSESWKCKRRQKSKELGLLHAWKLTMKCYPSRMRVPALLNDLRYAWQRAWYGFDDTDVSNLGRSEVRRIEVLLREFAAAIPLEGLWNPETEQVCSKEEVSSVLDEMIYLFESNDVLELYQRMYGVTLWEDERDGFQMRAKEVDEERRRRVEEGFRRFGKWCFHLW